MQYGHCTCLKWDESFHPIQSNRQHLIYSTKETGSKTVAIATSKYASCGAFLTCQIPIVLHHYSFNQAGSSFTALQFIYFASSCFTD